MLLAAGPSATLHAAAIVQQAAAIGRCRVLTINHAYRLAPWADVRFGADARWWAREPAAREGLSLKYTLSQPIPPLDGVTLLQRTGQRGIESSSTGLRSGGHSGYAAINLACHLGAARIILVGYDMCPDADGRHHSTAIGEHPDGSHPRYTQWLSLYTALAAIVADLGIVVLNASPSSAVTAFPRVRLAVALSACPQPGRSQRVL